MSTRYQSSVEERQGSYLANLGHKVVHGSPSRVVKYSHPVSLYGPGSKRPKSSDYRLSYAHQFDQKHRHSDQPAYAFERGRVSTIYEDMGHSPLRNKAKSQLRPSFIHAPLLEDTVGDPRNKYRAGNPFDQARPSDITRPRSTDHKGGRHPDLSFGE